jgi:hypothetical protein
MTAQESLVRQRLYVTQGTLSAFIAGIVSLDITDWRMCAAFFAGIALAYCNAMRAYLDGSTRDVKLPVLPDGLPTNEP